ncbi:MAG: type I 3-dehydroquinate dehydratase [Bacteroidales bacterium]|nr:type I 3-dehydroquinate dehydratase [Bacteroidales bacterium]
MLYVCLSAEGVENALRQLGDEKCAELRVDLVKPSMDEMVKLVSKKDFSFIVTCRPGVFDEETSLKYLATAAKHGADYIDIEIERGAEVASRMKAACEDSGCKLIISYHNFECTPSFEELRKVIMECRGRGADIVKIACKVNSTADNSTLMSLYGEGEGIVAFGMGTLGQVSRLASLGCGAKFTYVASDFGDGTAPGQLTVSQMRRYVNELGIKL